MNTPPAPGTTYRGSYASRIVAVLFFSFVTIFLVATLTEPLDDLADQPLRCFVPPILFFAGIFFLLHVFRSYIRFTSDSIELKTLLSKKTLPICHIKSRREWIDSGVDTNTRMITISSDDDIYPSLTFQRQYNFDAAFEQWFKSLPDQEDLDAHSKNSSHFGLV